MKTLSAVKARNSRSTIRTLARCTMFWLYFSFVAFVVVMLALDLGIVNRHAHVVRSREALAWTGLTVILALLFCGAVYIMYERDWPTGIAAHISAKQQVSGGAGLEAVVQYLSAWVTEYSLSVDNIFVIAIIFQFFKVPAQHQHRVLFWGVLGALVMRGMMIAAGTKIIQEFDWVKYIFGGFLLFTAVKLLYAKDESPHPDRNIAVRVARWFFPITPDYHGHRFFARMDGRLAMTPLFLVLLVVETTDVLFAVDSIPAAIGLTSDPFLVFTSNVFAILGLRSLYFALAAMMGSFRYLKVSLVFILAFVGLKMLFEDLLIIPPIVALPVILFILLAGVGASMFATAKERRKVQSPLDDLTEAVDITRRNLKRVLILIAGSAVILLGLALSPIPGPGGIPVIIAGLMILATEFVWAQRIVRRLKNQTNALTERADQVAQMTSPWVIPPVLLFLGAAMISIVQYGPWKHTTVYAASVAVWGLVLFWVWRVIVVHRRTLTARPKQPPTRKPAEPPSSEAHRSREKPG